MTSNGPYEFIFRHSSDKYATASILYEFLKTTLSVINIICWSCIRFFVPPMKKSLKEEVILITGGAGYLGRSMAVKLAKKGAKIVIWDINRENNESVKREIVAQGGEAYSFECNLCSREEIYRTAKQVRQQVGNPTIVINNAGIVGGQPLLELKDEKIVNAFSVNVLAHFWTTKAFLPAMLKANHGHIVSVASILGTDGLSGLTDYCSSKFAAVGFMQSLRREVKQMGKDGVHFTTVNPYLIDTGLFQGVTIKFKWMPLLQILKPDYVAEKVIDAIEKNQIVLHIPRVLYFTPVISSIVPALAADRLHDLIGSNNIMKTFIGHQRRETNGIVRELK